MIVTIDGRAGAGKTLAARRLAESLGFRLLHTGAMYRSAAIALQDAGYDIFATERDIPAITDFVSDFTFELPGHETWLNGVDYTTLIESEAAGAAASKVGTFPEVRARLKAEQRRIAAGQDTICEGRDQGTAVFPDAPVKFFVTASVEVRAKRRFDQEVRQGHHADLEALKELIRKRDEQDELRVIDPLKKAPDAIEVDTSTMTPDDVLAVMIAGVQQCRSRA
ncbi:(d)CMP kinase [soil metagenome]